MIEILFLLVGFINSEPPKQESAKYLVITNDDFYEAILPLAQWKHKKGVKTKVVKLSEIGSDTFQIKNYIQNAYNTWNPRPEYVLLVGDVEFLPTYWGEEIPTDNYYAALAGGDYLSDISIGRFSVDNAFECSTMVAKTLAYERTPWMSRDLYGQDGKWFHKTTLLLRDDYTWCDSTWYYPDIWFAYDLLEQNGYDIDTLFRKNGVDASSIVRSVNEGCGLIGYRGCAGRDWAPPFTIWPLDVLQNSWQFPVVMSGTCLTGAFQEDGFACEGWTRAGTPDNPKGAVAYVGSNRYTDPEPHSTLWRGFWTAIFTDSIFTLGDILIKAKWYLYNSPWQSKQEYESWNIVGDPELNLLTDTPKQLEVSYSPVIPQGSSNLTVNVRSDAVPVKNALVCLFKNDEVYVNGYTDAQGEAILSINSTTADTMWVTVTGHNYVPYEGYAIVISDGAYVHLLKHTIVDTTGNDDGISNPGELISLPLWVKNYGTVPAIGVNGLLSTSDTFVAITNSSEYFGSINALDSVATSKHYELLIAPNCPDKHTISFNLNCSDTVGSVWLSPFEITVASPVIAIYSKTIDDVGQSNPNGTIDPGETVKLIIRLNNSGSASAFSVSAILHTPDSYITISDSFSTYGNILADSTRSNSSNPFIVACSSSTPVYHKFPFSLRVSSTNGFTTTLHFTLKVGLGGDFLVWDPDYNHSSGTVIDTLLNFNGYVGDYTIELTKHRACLQNYKSIFICLGVPHYAYILAPGPDVNALCQYLDNGGRIYMESANTWVHDQNTNLHNYFHIMPYIDGLGDTDTLLGVAGTITEGMRYKYVGENRSMDRIKPSSPAWPIFKNFRRVYTNAVAFSSGWHKYKTIATSFELGGLLDGTPTRATLVDSIMQWFLRDPSHDVALWKVETPEYFVVQQHTKIEPAVKVKNIGQCQETFNVLCSIDSVSHNIYADTVNVSNIDTSAFKKVVFAPWTPSTANNTYIMQFRTLLQNDEEYQNNAHFVEVTSFPASTKCVNSRYTFVTPVINGYIDTTYEWKKATRFDISDVLNQTEIGPFPTNSAYLYVMHDSFYVYFGFDARWDKFLECSDGFTLYFDDNHNHLYPISPDSSEGQLRYRYFGNTLQVIDYNPITRDLGELGRYSVEMKGMSDFNSDLGNIQHEFALPFGELPAQLNAELGDTVGFSLTLGNFEQDEFYGWWPHQSSNIESPIEMGELVFRLPGANEIVKDSLPKIFGISQNIPNPFICGAKTSVLYQLPMKSKVSLKIYNTAGQLVRTFVDGIENAGYKKVIWDGKNNKGRYVASGIYLYRLEANSIKGDKHFTNTKKMIFFGRWK